MVISPRLFLLLAIVPAMAQDPVGSLEGVVQDGSGAAVEAEVTVTSASTGRVLRATAAMGRYRFALLPVGPYSIAVSAPNFAPFARNVEIDISQVLRVDVRLELAGARESVSVTADGAIVDIASNTLGKTVTGREILDLPLNGRNFTQLGLLQAGVAELTGGVSTSGGSLRAGQTYSVNGQRPESNAFLLDGARNNNRMDGGFALRPPVDSIAEFRILTHTAPPEYGGTAGANTSVVTKSGTNQTHGSLYEFFRNEVFDARNFFSRDVEPLKQNQFGGTLGGPLRADRIFGFAYAESFRNRQGITRSGNVPTAAQREGDFSARSTPLLDLASGGVPYPGNRIPASQFHPLGLRVAGLYPAANTTPSVHTATVVTENDSDQAGGRIDFLPSDRDQIAARFSFGRGSNLNPISVRGTDLPGFPVRDQLRTYSGALNGTRIFTPRLLASYRAAFFRHTFLFDQRLNRTSPRDFGFQYDSSSTEGQSLPFFNVNGYSPVGGAITGPRDSAQTSGEVYAAGSWTPGSHSLKFGGELRRTRLNVFQAIAPNAFFVFTPSFPSNDGFANLLMGRPLVFYQGRGDVSRGLRAWETGLFLQDEWRVRRTLTINAGLRWEVNPPFSEVRNRFNAFIPGVQSVVRPDAPAGLLYPGDPGVSAGVAPVFYGGVMPRIGLAWNPDGRGRTSIRAGYGIFFDPMSNGSGAASQAPVSSLPWTQLIQKSGPSVNFADPYGAAGPPSPDGLVRPLTLVVLDHNARPPYAQNWNFSIQQALFTHYLLDVRYVGSKGTRLPRNIEANPAVYGPGATAGNADQRRIHGNCVPGGPCTFTHVAMLSNITNSTYHAGQLSLSRRYQSGLGFNASYWFSKTLDYLSAMNLGGAAARPLAGENDIAQNPFDLRAEHGPSLFDARHRVVLSGSWAPRFAEGSTGAVRALFHGWQFQTIASFHSGTPFTVFDTTNVSLQASHPPVSGYSASRPDLVGDPNSGPRTVEQWLTRDAFRRLSPVADAGRFGNAGRNIARGPGRANVDVSVLRTFRLHEQMNLQFRVEAFNVANHANFALPISDLNSANFGRITEAGPSRLVQIAVKLLF